MYKGLESIFFICIERRRRIVLNDKLWLERVVVEILIEMGVIVVEVDEY